MANLSLISHLHPFISHNIASLPIFPSFYLSSSKSVFKQQAQASTPQQSPGPPLGTATSQPAAPGTPQQVTLPAEQLKESVFMHPDFFSSLTSSLFSDFLMQHPLDVQTP